MENNFLTKEEYINIKERAKKDSSFYEDYDASSKNKWVNAIANKIFDDSQKESKLVYISTFMINDDEDFMKIYNDYGKEINAVANHYNVSRNIIVYKITELAKYYNRYINNEITLQSIEKNLNIDNIKENEELMRLREENNRLIEEKAALLMEIELLKNNQKLIETYNIRKQALNDESSKDSHQK